MTGGKRKVRKRLYIYRAGSISDNITDEPQPRCRIDSDVAVNGGRQEVDSWWSLQLKKLNGTLCFYKHMNGARILSDGNSPLHLVSGLLVRVAHPALVVSRNDTTRSLASFQNPKLLDTIPTYLANSLKPCVIEGNNSEPGPWKSDKSVTAEPEQIYPTVNSDTSGSFGLEMLLLMIHKYSVPMNLTLLQIFYKRTRSNCLAPELSLKVLKK
jgi:hypothetical protein